MAGIDTGGHSGRRSTNHDIPLIPFIDFLLCLVMFLLVTAVWNHMARVEADANVPGPTEGRSAQDDKKELHVFLQGERTFQLKWKEGSTVVDTLSVPRKEVIVKGNVTYPELATVVTKQWKAHGKYQSATAKEFDRAVLHTDNSVEFSHVLATMDALNAPERDYTMAGGKTVKVPAFQVTFAAQ